ncbi:hypothetical protein CPLU01_12288 [Colletotrichum plurivorum]|uniref:Uncharacterized protein n=1 Tax=Colletotrichum plurivorum TaxID=2175906 RepID=A0A8H6JZM1_9PEZI|nr:hypothetical protein CPLU01_12288 [Colletotrichum plurivorum]
MQSRPDGTSHITPETRCGLPGLCHGGETSTDNGAGRAVGLAVVVAPTQWVMVRWWPSARDHRAEMAGTLNQRGGGRGKPGGTVEEERLALPNQLSLPFLVLGLSARPAISKCRR